VAESVNDGRARLGAMEGQLVRNVLLFGRVLRGLGLDVSPGRMTDLVEALQHVWRTLGLGLGIAVNREPS